MAAFLVHVDLDLPELVLSVPIKTNVPMDPIIVTLMQVALTMMVVSHVPAIWGGKEVVPYVQIQMNVLTQVFVVLMPHALTLMVVSHALVMLVSKVME